MQSIYRVDNIQTVPTSISSQYDVIHYNTQSRAESTSLTHHHSSISVIRLCSCCSFNSILHGHTSEKHALIEFGASAAVNTQNKPHFIVLQHLMCHLHYTATLRPNVRA